MRGHLYFDNFTVYLSQAREVESDRRNVITFQGQADVIINNFNSSIYYEKSDRTFIVFIGADVN